MNTQSSFERGLGVLITIAEQGDLSVEDIARELGMPSSTVYRYIRTLRDHEFIEEHAGRYTLGARLLKLSGHNLTHARLVEVGLGMLRDVAEGTSETAVLTVRVGAMAMCLRQVESSHPIRYAFRISQLLPLHAGAGQRVLLAFAPRAVVAKVLDGPLPRYTDQTHDRARLVHDLELIRHTGFAVSRGELNAGAIAVSMPVFSGGEIVCSLTVAGPEARCAGQLWLTHARTVLRAACQVLGEALDHGSPAG